VRSSPLKSTGMDHTVFRLQSTPHLPLPRKAFTRRRYHR